MSSVALIILLEVAMMLAFASGDSGEQKASEESEEVDMNKICLSGIQDIERGC